MATTFMTSLVDAQEEDYKRDKYAFRPRRNDVDLSSYQSRKAVILERKSISI
jgi:hypothetical protein